MKIDKILNIHPKKINSILDIKFDVTANPKVSDGNWDDTSNHILLENDILYSSIYSMFKQNVEWEDTPLYKFMIDSVKRGNASWSCATEEMCRNRKKYIHNLYKDIESAGKIFLKEEIFSNKNIKTKKNFKSEDEQYKRNDNIHMVIDRNGKFHFARNGCHRFSMAKILNFETIPVMVCHRHAEWEKFRKEVFDMCKELWGGNSYQKIPHPDFDEIQPIHSVDRYELFKKHTKLKNGKLLDIGSLFGYMCYRAELDGFDCTAVEIDTSYLRVMRKLHDAYEMKYSIFEGTVFNLDKKNHDVVIAFNIFHHFLKTKGNYDKLKKFLSELEYKEMFIQFHRTDESQMVGSYKNYTEEEFSKFIIENSKNKSSFEFIGEFDGRKIAKIY